MDRIAKWEPLTTELDKAFKTSLDDEEPTTEEESSNVETSGCGHPIPPAFKERLGDRKLCPPCLIDDHFEDIRQIKAAFERRGGIFGSRTRSTVHIDLKHKDYVKMWTVAKIQCYRDVELLEKLRDDHSDQAEEWGVLEGLGHWEQSRDEATRVPGYKYVEDQVVESKGAPTEESESEPEPSIAEVEKPDVDVGTSWPVTPEEMKVLLAKDREYHVVASKPKKRKRRNVNLTVSTGSTIDDTSTTRSEIPASRDGDVLQEMEDVTKRLDQRLSIGNWDLFDAIAGAETNALQYSTNKTHPRSTPPLTPITPRTVALPSTPSQRSVLKGTRITPLRSHTTFTNHTTIITPGSLPSIQEPHNKHTNASNARIRGNFHRTSPWYREGTWASSDGFEKWDTSFMRMTWFRYEKYVRAPPVVKEKKVWMKEVEVTARPDFQSEISDAMDGVRERKQEREIANATSGV